MITFFDCISKLNPHFVALQVASYVPGSFSLLAGGSFSVGLKVNSIRDALFCVGSFSLLHVINKVWVLTSLGIGLISPIVVFPPFRSREFGNPLI